jgi:predicted AlkP superfamily phosphohydrolase/phosphomutase
MLSNSLVAALLATCYVLVLVIQLNPRLPLNPVRLVPIAESFGLIYAIHLTAIFYAILVGRQLLGRELFSPAWISISVLAWLAAAASAAGAGLMLANVRTFSLVLQPETVAAMRFGAVALAVSSLLFVIIGLARRFGDSERRALWATCLVIVAAASVAVPMILRGRGAIPPLEARPLDAIVDSPAAAASQHGGRVTIMAVDAASLDLIARAAAEGRLPNFGRILDAGAVLQLATLHPTSAEAVWTAVATGKLPQKNGVRSAAVYRAAAGGDPIRLLPDFCFATGLMRFGVLTEEPLTSTALRARPLWSILTLLGVQTGVVNWPLTHPAPVVRGYVVSDAYVRLAPTLSGLDDPSLVYPPTLSAELNEIVQVPQADLRPIVATASVTPARHRISARTDALHEHIVQALERERPSQVSIVRYQSLDAIGHYYLRYAAPQEFGDIVSDEDRRRFGQVLESHYSLIDDAIGRATAALGPDDLLLVVSGYGMEPLSLGKRLLERVIGDPEISGTHEAAPDGFLMAYGPQVARTRGRAAVVDVAPTVLYFLGLPVARDMDGYARTDLFLPSFTEERPITFIPTYER